MDENVKKVEEEQVKVEGKDSQADEVIKEEKGESKPTNTEPTGLGKFKDVASLLSAYNSLQAEFTKRCQKIKELESAITVDKVNAPTQKNLDTESNKSITDKDKEDVLKDYLKNLLNTKQQAIILDNVGHGVKAPIAKPKTIAEAGLLAKDLLTKKDN